MQGEALKNLHVSAQIYLCTTFSKYFLNAAGSMGNGWEHLVSYGRWGKSGLSALSFHIHGPDCSASPPAPPRDPTHFLYLLLDLSQPNFFQETSLSYKLNSLSLLCILLVHPIASICTWRVASEMGSYLLYITSSFPLRKWTPSK